MLDVDVVAVYTADEVGRFEDHPVVWHPDRLPDLNDGPLSLTGASRRFLEGVAARKGTLALADVAALPESPDGTGEPAFVDTTGYAAWVLSPVHDADDRLLALLRPRTGPPGGRVERRRHRPDRLGGRRPSVGPSSRPTSTPGSSGASASSRTSTVPRASSCPPSPTSFRTPLTSIRAYAELLRDEDGIGRDEDRMLEIIEKNSVRLSVLIEDILTLSHLNSAVYDIHLVPVDVNPLIEAACESLLPTAEAKSLTLAARIARGPGPGPRRRAPARASAAQPGQQRRQVHPGRRTRPRGRLRCRRRRSSCRSSTTGIGIPADEQEAVFGRFVRGNEATREVIPGTGLGLAIVQAIVEHHGGTLSLTSAPGQRHHGPGAPAVAGPPPRPHTNSRLKAGPQPPIQKWRICCRWASGPPVPGRTCLTTPESIEAHSKEHQR